MSVDERKPLPVPLVTRQPSYVDHATDGEGAKPDYVRGSLIVGAIWGISTLALVKVTVWGTVEIAKSSDPVGLLRAVEESDGAPWPWLGFLAALIGFIPLAVLLPIVIQRIHKRSWRTSATPFRTMSTAQLARGAAVWAVIYALVVLVTALAMRGQITVAFDWGDFTPAVLLLVVLSPVQAFGQELLFRGYNIQFASLDTSVKGIIAFVSGLTFGLPFLFSPWVVQWVVPEVKVPDAPLSERLLLLIGYIALGMALALVSLRTGTIEFAIGAAFANNLLVGLMLAPHGGTLSGGSILTLEQGFSGIALYTILLVAGLVLFTLSARRFVPDPGSRPLFDHPTRGMFGDPAIRQPQGNAMWRITLRGLLTHRLRLVLSILAITLGVSFIVGTIVFADTTNRALERFYDNEPADVVVSPVDEVTVQGRGGAPPALTMAEGVAAQIAKVPGVRAAVPTVNQEGVLILDANNDPVGGSRTAHIGVSYDPDIDIAASESDQTVVSFDGELPVGIGQVAVDTTTATRIGLQVGDEIRLSTPMRTDSSRPWRVTGIIDIGLSGGATVALFDLPTAQTLITGEGTINTVLVTIDDTASAADVAEAINGELGDPRIAAITGREAADRAESRVTEALGFLNTLMLVFALIAVLMSTFLIFNTFSMLIAQRTRELALVRAVGAARDQLQGSVLIQAVLVGIVGTTLGCAVGIALSFGLRRMLQLFDIDVPVGGLVIEPRMLLIAGVLGIGVTVLAAWLPAIRASRTPPVQAMQSETSPSRAGAVQRNTTGVILAGLAAVTAAIGFRDSLPENALAWMGLSALIAIGAFVTLAPALANLVLRVLGLPFRSAIGKLATGNTRRNRRRTTATAAALTIGVAIMTIVTVLATSTTATADTEIDKAIGSDLSVGAPPSYRPFDHTITEQIAAVAGVADTTFIRTTVGERGKMAVPVFGVEPEKITEAINLTIVSGDLTDVGGDSVAVDSRLAARYDLQVGDDFQGTFRTGPAEFRIAAVFEPIIVYEGLLTDLATAQDLGALPAQDNAAYLNLTEGADPAQVGSEIEQIIARNPALQLQDASVLKEDFRNSINQLLAFVYAMLALAVLIGVLGIINTLLLSVHERTAELGLLRAVGATQDQVRRMIVIEAAVVGLFGAVTGVALGLLYGMFLQIVMAPLGIQQLDIPWLILAVFVAAGALAGVIAAVWPAITASRLNILRAIATE